MVIPDDIKTLTDEELITLKWQLYEKIGDIEVERLNRGFVQELPFNPDDTTRES